MDIKQITIDDNNVVTACSIGGYIENGIDVDVIPDEVMNCPNKYKFVDGEFIINADYIEPQLQQDTLTIDDLALAIADLAELIGGAL